MCIYVYIHIHMYIYQSKELRALAEARTQYKSYSSKRIRTYIHTRTDTCLHVYGDTYVCICMYIYIPE